MAFLMLIIGNKSESFLLPIAEIRSAIAEPETIPDFEPQ